MEVSKEKLFECQELKSEPRSHDSQALGDLLIKE